MAVATARSSPSSPADGSGDCHDGDHRDDDNDDDRRRRRSGPHRRKHRDDDAIRRRSRSILLDGGWDDDGDDGIATSNATMRCRRAGATTASSLSIIKGMYYTNILFVRLSVVPTPDRREGHAFSDSVM